MTHSLNILNSKELRNKQYQEIFNKNLRPENLILMLMFFIGLKNDQNIYIFKYIIYSTI